MSGVELIIISVIMSLAFLILTSSGMSEIIY
jgi:hypothetical protein